MFLSFKVQIARVVKQCVRAVDGITDVFFSAVGIFGKKMRHVNFLAVDKNAAKVFIIADDVNPSTMCCSTDRPDLERPRSPESLPMRWEHI